MLFIPTQLSTLTKSCNNAFGKVVTVLASASLHENSLHEAAQTSSAALNLSKCLTRHVDV